MAHRQIHCTRIHDNGTREAVCAACGKVSKMDNEGEPKGNWVSQGKWLTTKGTWWCSRRCAGLPPKKGK